MRLKLHVKIPNGTTPALHAVLIINVLIVII